MKKEPKVYIKCTEEEAKVHIEFTKEEIDITYYALMQEMEKSFKKIGEFGNLRTVEHKSPDDLFKILEHWYLLLKKIKEAKDIYEQATSEKEN